ncbi:tripartite tricarboxylate transporter TctB family protein [Novispirillum itersonii]|uniref:tripartite tricarboxylate transporter TctB family protein n=1 Tax=Novispirillum itersonii TaxID=189 RepID=UPI000361BB86|nr:tripartite tricarboxylate transporter TctB family protein [Novispirillum itersonii]
MPQAQVRRWEASFGVKVLSIGGAIAIGISSLPETAVVQAVGPKVFPLLIAAAMMAVGLAIVIRSMVMKNADAAEIPAMDVPPFLMVSGGLLAQIVLMEHAGFIIASTILFLATARAFGSRSLRRDIIVALVLSVAAYAGFTAGLGLTLPAGPFTDVF